MKKCSVHSGIGTAEASEVDDVSSKVKQALKEAHQSLVYVVVNPNVWSDHEACCCLECNQTSTVAFQPGAHIVGLCELYHVGWFPKEHVPVPEDYGYHDSVSILFR